MEVVVPVTLLDIVSSGAISISGRDSGASTAALFFRAVAIAVRTAHIAVQVHEDKGVTVRVSLWGREVNQFPLSHVDEP